MTICDVQTNVTSNVGLTPDNNVMHAKPDLRVFLKWMIARSGSVITDVIRLVNQVLRNLSSLQCERSKMKMSEITEPLVALIDDTIEAQNLASSRDDGFSRRTYVRCLFTYIEGTVWLTKMACLRATCDPCRRISQPELDALLQDQAHEVDNRGEIVQKKKFIPVASNLRFACKTFNSLFDGDIELHLGEKQWNNFLTAIEIRNRITHPKSIADLKISDEEFELCRNSVCVWFNFIAHRVLKILSEK